MVCLLKNRKMLRRNAGEAGMLPRRAAGPNGACCTRRCAPLRGAGGAQRRFGLGGLLRGTALRSSDEGTGFAHEVGRAAARRRNLGCASLPTANFRRRGRLIRENIIGHAMRGFVMPIAV